MKENMKQRILALFLAFCMIVGLMPATARAAENSGTCGEGVTWSFDEAAGKLTISGNGIMDDFASGNTPWSAYRDSITAVEIGEGVSNIGTSAFYDCTNLVTADLPESLTSIGYGAFEYCSVLENVTIPDQVTSIEGNAFSGCWAITSISIPEGITVLESGVFDNCKKLASVTLPESLTVIESSAFSNCECLTDINIPDSVHTIDDSAFCYCIALSEVSLPADLNYLGSYCFEYCSSLTSITIPAAVSWIGGNAFYECNGLQEIWFCGNVPNIGEMPFKRVQCNAYYPADKVTWHEDAMISLGSKLTWAAYGDAPIVPAPIPDEITISGNCGDGITWMLGQTSGYLTISGTGAIPNYTETNPGPWCTYKDQIFAAEIEEGITAIGEHAFYGCEQMHTVNIADSVTAIRSSAFRNCSSLQNVSISAAVTTIGGYAFKSCSSLEGIWVDEENTVYSSDPRGVLFDRYKDRLIQAPGALTGFYRLPDYLEEISDSAFLGCKDLTGVLIPGSLESIKSSAFLGCSSLKHITLPHNIYQIPEAAFSGCSALTGVTLLCNYVRRIENRAFENCTSLTDFVIPDSVSYIGASAFSKCSSLREVVIPEGVTEILIWTFSGCTNLERVTISPNVTTIGNYAFENCTSLTEITIPSSVEVIGYTPFIGCTSLQKIKVDEANTTYESDDHGALYSKGQTILYWVPVGVTGEYTIPASVVQITMAAFTDAKGLTAVYFEGNAPQISDNSFADLEMTAYYPAGNATWTVAVMQNYGGTITWIPYGEEPKPTEPEPTEPEPTEPEPTEPEPTEPEPTEPEPTEPEPTDPGPTENPFTDVSEDKYYYDPILWAYENGITTGATATTFAPNKDCTRGQIVTFLWRAAGEPEPTATNNPFTDVDSDDFYYKAVLWAVENGITTGATTTTFNPKGACNRAQVVTFMWRAAGEPTPTSANNPFGDVPADKYYHHAVLWAVEQEITNGISATKFAPNNTCTRGQIVTFLYRGYAK